MTKTLFVARSRSLQEWGGEVGLTKNLYKVGLADGAKDAIEQALNEGRCAGRTDWTVIKSEDAGPLDEATALEQLSRKETLIDPKYYPQIKGEAGIVKVKVANVENHFLVQNALSGLLPKAVRLVPATIATYLLRTAQG